MEADSPLAIIINKFLRHSADEGKKAEERLEEGKGEQRTKGLYERETVKKYCERKINSSRGEDENRGQRQS